MNAILTLLGFAVAVAFWPGVIDPATEPRWISMAIGVPVAIAMLHDEPRVPWWTLAWLPAAAVTLLWSPDVLSGADDLVHLAILAAVFCLGAAVEDPAPVWRGIAAGVAVSAVIALAQGYGWDSIPQAVPPAGLFVNRNVLGEAAMIAVITASASISWPFALVAVALTASKAVLGALALACAAHLSRRRPRVAIVLATSVCAAGVGYFLAGAPSALERLAIWRPAIDRLTPFGNGLGSFAATFPEHWHAHSEPLQLAYELGIFALPFGCAFIYAIGGAQRDNPPARESSRLVLVAVTAVSLLSFPLHMPLTAFAAALAAGHLVAARYRLCGDERDRAGTNRGGNGRSAAPDQRADRGAGPCDQRLPACAAAALHPRRAAEDSLVDGRGDHHIGPVSV